MKQPLVAFLEGLTCAAPFTLADARELFDLVKGYAPTASAEVNLIDRGARVAVDVRERDGVRITRVFDVQTPPG